MLSLYVGFTLYQITMHYCRMIENTIKYTYYFQQMNITNLPYIRFITFTNQLILQSFS